MKVILQWIGDKFRKNKFTEAQNYIDSTCLERMTEFVPVALPKYKNAGQLRDSAEIPEPGRIIYTAPFAKSDYYADKNHKWGGNPKATKLWFETMKRRYKDEIFEGVKKKLR